jgi:threonine dehydrogenase-like Zn-dependent dehydrogenase
VRAAVVVEPGRLEVDEVPEPELGAYRARVRTLAGGLCGTDRHIINGTFYRRDYPAILGHEALGQVVEIGRSVRHLAPGDMVLRTTTARPGERLGRYASMLGSFAEFALATDIEALAEDARDTEIKPYDRLQKVVPAGFDPVDVGAFTVLKETLSWLGRLADPAGRRVLVVGTGPAALSFVQVAKLRGAAQVIVLGRRQGRLDHARRLGADDAISSSTGDLSKVIRERTDGQGVDIAIEAAGAVDVLEVIPDCLARAGILGVYGLSVGQTATFRWGWDRPVPRQWSLRFEEPDEAGIHEEALALATSGRYQLKSTLTHVYPFDQIADAVAMMVQEEACKVAIDFRDGARPR